MSIRDKRDNAINTGSSLLKTVVGMSPIGVGAYFAYNNFINTEVMPDILPTQTPTNILGEVQGLKARSVNKARAAKAAKFVEELKKGLHASDELRQLFSTLQEHNSLLHTLSRTLEDPATGLNSHAVEQLRSEVANLMGKPDSKTVEELTERIIETIRTTGTPEVFERFQENFKEYAKIGGQLRAPTYKLPKSGRAVNEIEAGKIPNTVKSQFERLKTGLNKHNLSVEMLAYIENDQQIFQAQVYGGRGWKTSIPLGQTRLIRSGESLNTLYAVPRGALDVSRVHTQLKTNPDLDLGVISLSNNRSLKSYSDYSIDTLLDRLNQGPMDWRAYRELQRKHMQHTPRAAKINKHIMTQAVLESNTVLLHNMGKLDTEIASDIVSRIASSTGFEAGAAGSKRLMEGWGDQRSGILSFKSGSAFESLQNFYGDWAINRRTLPVTARESQITGRNVISTKQSTKVGSATIGRIERNQIDTLGRGWGIHGAGGQRALFTIDFKKNGFLNQTLVDSGMAYTGSSIGYMEAKDFSILDPRVHKHAATETFEKILESPNRAIRLSASEIAQGKALGETANGLKMVPRTPHVKEMVLIYDDTGTNSGKTLNYLTSLSRSETDTAKIFSMMMKGTVQNTGKEGIDMLHRQDAGRHKGRLNAHQKTLERVGLENTRYEQIYTDNAMFSKGTSIMTMAIAGTAENVGISTPDLRKAAEIIKSSGVSRLGGTGHGIYAEAAFNEMVARNIDPSYIGSTLSGLFHMTYDSDVGKRKAAEETWGTSRKEIVKMIMDSSLQPEQKKQVIKAMAAGIMTTTDLATLGPTIDSWGEGKTGTERRYAINVFERMKRIGMEDKRAAEIVSEIYSHKKGFGRHYQMAEQLFDMVRSISGESSIIDAYTQRNATKVNYVELADTLTANRGTGQLADFLRLQKNGTILDFSNAAAPVYNAIKKVFETDALALPGVQAFEAAIGTTIKQAGGQDKAIDDALSQLMNSLQGRLSQYSILGGEPLEQSLREWKTEAVSLFSHMTSQLSAGKIKGSSSPKVTQINLNTGATLNRKQLRITKRLARGTGLTATYGDTTYFLSELYGQKSEGVARKDLARQAQSFFLGMEYKSNKKQLASGVLRIGGRDPMISPGNVFLSQIYRTVTETAQYGEDKFFEQVKNATFKIGDEELSGAIYMQRLFHAKVNSFQDIAEISTKSKIGAKRAQTFFRTFIKNLEQFTGGEGGGVVTQLRYFTSELGDIGLSPQAFMDFDGDSAKSVALSDKVSKEIKRKMIEYNKNVDNFTNEIHLRSFKNKIGSAIKKGIIEYGSSLGHNVTEEELNFQDIRKEIGSINDIGPLDVRLRSAHDALVNSGLERHRIDFARDLVGSLNEHVVLKGKKLKFYTNIAGEVGDAFRLVSENPDAQNEQILRDVLRNKVFMNQNPNITMNSRTKDVGDMAKWLNASTNGKDVTINLDNIIDDIMISLRGRKARGENFSGTAKDYAAKIIKDPSGSISSLMAGDIMEGAALKAASDSPVYASKGTANKIVSQLGDAINKVDKRMTAPLALGAAGALVLSGIIGATNYSPEPLMDGGEYVDPAIQNAIAKGSLFKSSDININPENFGMKPSLGYDMNGTPINTGNMYINRPSSYGIHGTVSDFNGLDHVANFINNVTGNSSSGSIRINDMRRPISRSYVDRLQGDY